MYLKVYLNILETGYPIFRTLNCEHIANHCQIDNVFALGIIPNSIKAPFTNSWP